MRGLVIAAFAAVVTSSGCVQPQPSAPVEAPASRAPAAADAEQTTPAEAAPPPAAAQSGAAPPALREPSPVATTPSVTTPSMRPATAVTEPSPPAEPASTAVAPDAALAGADDRATPAPPEETPPVEPVAAQASPPPEDVTVEIAAAPPPEEVPVPAPIAALPAAADAAARALDLAGLEQRLRDTQAIGVFTKLSLKNQVDDLLGQFRAFYRGQLTVQLAELRQRYELLLFKVLTLLQDSDRDLAEAIAASREAIWGILSDPQKLAQI